MTGLQVRPERDYVADLIHAELDQALDAAASRAARAAPGLVIVTDPLAGPPAQAVTESGSGALMLVVGSRGAGAFTAMTLGSVSRYAAAHAGCPVVVIRDPNPVPSAQVGVGVGDPEDCPGSLTFAFEEAGLHKASLLAVHACPAPDAAEAAARLAELLEKLAGEVSRRPGQPPGRARPPGPGPGRPVRPCRPGRHGQARRASRPARTRQGQARGAEPRPRPGRRRSYREMKVLTGDPRRWPP
jgi:hypothetical protein